MYEDPKDEIYTKYKNEIDDKEFDQVYKKVINEWLYGNK